MTEENPPVSALEIDSTIKKDDGLKSLDMFAEEELEVVDPDAPKAFQLYDETLDAPVTCPFCKKSFSL